MYGMEFASMLTHSDSINWHSKTKLGNQDDNKFMLTAKPHSHILNKHIWIYDESKFTHHWHFSSHVTIFDCMWIPYSSIFVPHLSLYCRLNEWSTVFFLYSFAITNPPPSFLSTGDARVMGQTSVSVQHLQDGAEEKSTGRAGCPELLRCYK